MARREKQIRKYIRRKMEKIMQGNEYDTRECKTERERKRNEGVERQ